MAGECLKVLERYFGFQTPGIRVTPIFVYVQFKQHYLDVVWLESSPTDSVFVVPLQTLCSTFDINKPLKQAVILPDDLDSLEIDVEVNLEQGFAVLQPQMQ